MEISDSQLKRLFHVPWLPCAEKKSQTTYLVKFCASPDDVSCWVLITDTRRVWAEVLQTRHILRRAALLNPEEDVTWVTRTEKRQRRFVRTWLDMLHAAHNLTHVHDIVIETQLDEPESHADLSMKITIPGLTWCWHAFALRPTHAAQVLSDHLIRPVLGILPVALAASEALENMPTEDIQKALDKTGKTARVLQHAHLRALFMNPFVACGLTRMAQHIDSAHQTDLFPVVKDLNELPEPQALDFGDAESESSIEDTEPEVISDAPIHSSPPPIPSSSTKSYASSSSSETEDDDDAEIGRPSKRPRTKPRNPRMRSQPQKPVYPPAPPLPRALSAGYVKNHRVLGPWQKACGMKTLPPDPDELEVKAYNRSMIKLRTQFGDANYGGSTGSRKKQARLERGPRI